MVFQNYYRNTLSKSLRDLGIAGLVVIGSLSDDGREGAQQNITMPRRLVFSYTISLCTSSVYGALGCMSLDKVDTNRDLLSPDYSRAYRLLNAWWKSLAGNTAGNVADAYCPQDRGNIRLMAAAETVLNLNDNRERAGIGARSKTIRRLSFSCTAELAEFIGQKKLKDQLAVAIEAARSRGEAMDHGFLWAARTGKDKLANIIANELGVHFQPTAAPLLQIKGDHGDHHQHAGQASPVH